MKNLNFLSNLCGLGRASQSSDVGSRRRVVADLLPSFCRVNMLKLVSVLVLVLTIGVGNVWGAADYIIPKLYLSARNTPSGNTGWTFTSATCNNAGTDYWKMVSNSSVVTSPTFDISGYTNVTVSIKWGSFGSFNKTKCNATVKISTGAGTWATLGKTGLTGASTSGTVYNFSNVEESSSYSSAQIQISTPSADGSIGGRLYYVEIKGEAAGSCDASPTVGNAAYNGALVYSTTPMTVPITCPSIGAGSSCEIKDYGFVWKAGGNPTISNNKTQIGTDNHSTAFNGNISGTFAAGTTYYVKAYAINNGDNTTLSSSAYSFTPRSITFNSNGGSSVSTILVISGKAASEPTAPTKDGYTFGGWYTDSGLGTAVNWSSTITSNKIYYAKWIAEPTITISETSRAFGDRKVNGGPYTMTFNVSGANLTNNISLSISGTNAGMFSVTPSSLTQSAGSVSSTEITVSYSPTSAGSHSATINITSSGATSKTVALSGTGKWEVTWSNNGATSTTLVENSTKPTFPSTPSSCDATSTTFIGWATAEWDGKIASLAGKTVHTSNSTMSNITANGTTFYAVFAKQSGSGDPTWVQTTSVAVDDVVVIAEIDHKADGKTGKELAGWGGSTYGTGADYTTTPAGTITWTVVTGYNSTGVAFKNSSNKYLYWNSSNSLDVNSTLSANSSWSVSEESSRAKIQNNATNTRVICWNEASPRFAAYDSKSHGDATSSGASTKFYFPVFYKQTPGYTYSDYLTTCCADPGLAYGTGSVAKTFGDGTFTNTLTNSNSVAVSYASSVPEVATVAADGTVTIVGAGSTTITASCVQQTISSTTYCADEASYTLTVSKADISPTLTYSPNSVAVGDNSATPSVGGNTGSGGVTYAITSASPAGCATINTSTGVVTGVAVGSVTVTATVGATTNYNSNTATATVTITAASYFTNGATVFIQAESSSAWDASACVKAWFNASGAGGSAEETHWLFDATGGDAGKKLFATVVPDDDLNQVTLQRFEDGCGSFWNNNGTLTKASDGGSNTFRSTGSGTSNVAWNASGVTMELHGDPSGDAWESSLADVTDQGNGIWSGTYSNYAPANVAGTSQDFKIKTNYNGWIGNTGSNSNATLSGMIVGSTYNVTATLNVTTHALTMSKTFVKGEVNFDLQGHGDAIAKLTNVTAGSKISAPSEPSAEGYTFGGWYDEAACRDGHEWNFASDEVNETMTLYAKWTVQTYTITKTLTNVANAGLPASFIYTGSTTTALNSTFTVDATNYFLPASITVTMGGSTLTQGTHYTYNNTTGAFTFDVKITGNIVITAAATAKLKSIAITTQPTTRAYLAGETFSSTGAVVTATMGDGTTKAVTASATWTPSGALTAETGKTVTATYTEAGIETTATTTINVYSVTVQKYDETPTEITNPGVTASASGRTLSQSVGSTKYVFNNWSLVTASGMSISTNSLTGTPTGNVVVRANFYKPVVITWLKGGDEYSTGGPTTEVARGAQWKDLTLPTAPADNSLGACADKFMGWSNTMAEEWVKEDTHTAPATLFTSVTGNTTVINAPITFRAVFASAEEGDNFELVTSLSGIKEGDAYMGSYISYSGTRYYAGTSNSAMTSVTVSGTPLALSSTTGLKKVSIVATGNTNQYYIKDGTKFLYANSAGSAPTFSDNTCAWTFSGPDGNKLFTILSSLGTYYLRAYASSTSAGQFKMYGNTTNSGICLFQKGVAYSDYVTVCCTQYDITLASSGSVTGGTFTASPTSACEDAEVTLSATPADGYSFAGWTVTKTASPYTDITSTNVEGNTLTMPAYGVTVNASFATLTGITVKTAPTKTTYCEGDNFDPTGLVITASFSNSTTLDIPYSGNEAKFTFSPTTAASLTTGNTSVTITYSGQSTSQAITVNSKLAVTKTGSGTVTGGTFTVDNATACVGTTINIEAAAASHYTFGSWTITKTSDGTDVTASVSIGSATSATTSFTMPAYGVTVTPTFNEDAYHTATFKNNGAVIAGYDAVKTYDGERPSAPTLTDITDACDKTDCNKFYGWIAEAGIWDKTINSVAGKTIYRNASSIPVVSGADVVYHAVWAKGTGVSIDNTLIAKWDKQALTASTAVYAKDKDGNTLDGTSGRATVTMTSTIDLNSDGIYGYYKSSISSNPTITISGLDFSGYSGGTIVFYARASAASGGFTAQYSTNNGVSYSDLSWEDATTTTEYSYIIPVSNSTTNVKISYTKNTGNFYFGTVRVYGDTDTDYDFTELTSSNTSGWSGADWDGYYLISAYYSSESKNVVLRSDVMEGLYGFSDVTPSTGVITTDDLGEIFKVTYNSSTNKYAIQSVATQDYLTTTGGGVNSKAYYLLSTSPTENNAIAYNDITQVVSSDTYYIRWNSDRFGSYKNQTSPTLYKIFDSYTEFRITCCDKTVTIGTPDKTGSGTVTFESGGDAYAAGDEVETCYGATTITATVTPTNGYQCTVLSFSRSDEAALTPDPAISVPFTGAQSYDLTFEQNTNATLATTVTFTALVDHYIDNMHYNTTQNKSGNYGTAPTLNDETKGEQCTGLHYRFIGWIPESDMNMTTGVPTTTTNMVAGGATGKYATGTNYYAIWAEEE